MAEPLADKQDGRAPVSPWLIDVVVLAAVAMVVLSLARNQQIAQDYVSFVAAEQVVGTEPDAVYLPGDASSLFDVAPPFQAACDVYPSSSEGAWCTAYVALPPALGLPAVVRGVPEPARRWVWSLGFLGLALVPLGLAWRRMTEGRATDGARTTWMVGLIGTTGVLGYGIAVGQVSTVLLAGIVMWRPKASWASTLAFASVLSLAIWLKLTPVIAWMALLMLASWRSWTATSVVLGVSALASLALWGVSLWADWWLSVRALAGYVPVMWQNASLEGVMGSFVFQDGPLLRTISPPMRYGALGLKACVAGGLLWLSVRLRRTAPERSWRLVWAATLSLSPLLWVHYFVVLPGLLMPLAASLERVKVRRALFLVPHVLLGVVGTLLLFEDARDWVRPLALATWVVSLVAMALDARWAASEA